MTDGALIWVDGQGDITLEGDDLLLDDTLTNRVIISLFTDRAVNEDELEPDQSNRGWWGDGFSDTPWGGRLWLLWREKSLDEVTEDAEDYSREALQWMIDERLVDAVTVNATRESIEKEGVRNSLVLNIVLTLPKEARREQRVLKIVLENMA